MSATYIPSQNFPPNSTQSQLAFTSPPKPSRTPKIPSSSRFSTTTQPQSSPPQYSFSKKRSRNDDDDTPVLASSPTRPIHALKRTLRHSPSEVPTPPTPPFNALTALPGTYEMTIPDPTFTSPGFTLILSFAPPPPSTFPHQQQPQLWASFNLGLLTGLLRFLRTPTHLPETIPVEILVRDDYGGSVERDMGEVRFVEDGRVLGRIEGAAFLLGGRGEWVAEKICAEGVEGGGIVGEEGMGLGERMREEWDVWVREEGDEFGEVVREMEMDEEMEGMGW